jgi:hypothetical protein
MQRAASFLHEPAEQSDLSQNQSRGRPHPDSGAHLGHGSVARMYDTSDSILAQKLSQVNGVGQVFVYGSAPPAVRVEVNPMLLNKLGVGLDTVRNALNLANANQAKGQVSGHALQYLQRQRSALHRGSVPAADCGLPQRRARCG